MSYAPFPSNDGNELYDSAQAASFRLMDAEKIAADRLETGGDGSLKEALASIGATIVGTSGTPADDVERLVDRIEAAQAGYNAAALDFSTLPFPAEPLSDGAGGEALDLTLLGLRDWSDARAAVAAELAETQSQPLFLQTDARQTAGTYWQPVERDAVPYFHPEETVASQATAAMPEPAAEPPRPEPLMPEPSGPKPPTQPAEAPIAHALDAAAKLAADANAAAAALESLTRLLQDHQRPASVIPSPQQVAQRPPQPAPRPPAPAAQPQRQALRPAVAAQVPATRPVTPPALRPVPVPHDARQLDFRGFMAGFALSWAIGAVLYIYLLVG